MILLLIVFVQLLCTVQCVTNSTPGTPRNPEYHLAHHLINPMEEEKNIDWSNWKRHGYLTEKEFNTIKKEYEELFNFYDIETEKMSLLEIGSGHGRLTLIYEKLFKKILAIDSEKSLIDLFNKKIKEENLIKIKTKTVKFEKFKSKKKFDLIIFSQSFLWMDNKEECLSKVKDLLNFKSDLLNFKSDLKSDIYIENKKSNGYLLVVEPYFMTKFHKKFKLNHKRMIDSLNTLITSKHFELIHFHTKGKNCSRTYYLLQ